MEELPRKSELAKLPVAEMAWENDVMQSSDSGNSMNRATEPRTERREVDRELGRALSDALSDILAAEKPRRTKN